MATVYYEQDCDLSLVRERKIAVIGLPIDPSGFWSEYENSILEKLRERSLRSTARMWSP